MNRIEIALRKQSPTAHAFWRSLTIFIIGYIGLKEAINFSPPIIAIIVAFTSLTIFVIGFAFTIKFIMAE